MTDLFYTLGTVVGGLLPGGEDPSDSDLVPAGVDEDDATPEDDSGDLLVDTILASAAGWAIKTALRPKSVSWPRVIVAGIGATVLAEVLGRAIGGSGLDGPEDEDDDALLLRIGSGVAMAAGYASILYPRLPGSPLTKGVIFGVMELAASPYGGLVRVASDTPGLKFPLNDLALPIDDGAGPVASLAFGVGLGVLYRPSLTGADPDDED